MAWQWALRGAFLGAAGTLEFLTREHSRQVPTSPTLWNGAALVALGLLVAGEAARRRSERWSQGLAGAGVGAFLLLGLFLAMTRPAPEAGYPLILVATVYAFLRLGPEAGLFVMLVGAAEGGFLAGIHAGSGLLFCLLFLAFARPKPERWQVAALLGIGGFCAASALAGWFPSEMRLLPTVIAPWLLHFGSPHPWRWTAIAAALALFWFWPGEGEEPRTAEAALALAAGLLLLAAPLARRLARGPREPDTAAVRSALLPLVAAAVVAVAWVVPLEVRQRGAALGALLMVLLLSWVGRRLHLRWLWVPAAALATLLLLAEGL